MKRMRARMVTISHLRRRGSLLTHGSRALRSRKLVGHHRKKASYKQEMTKTKKTSFRTLTSRTMTRQTPLRSGCRWKTSSVS